MRKLVIFGDSLFAERLSKYIIIERKDRVVAFTQEERFMHRSAINGVPVIPFHKLNADLRNDFFIILGLGYSRMNFLRKEVYQMCLSAGYIVDSYISTQALIYSDNIDEGNFVCPGAVIGPGCKLGIGNYMESGTILTHDNIVGSFNFFSTNTICGGFTKIMNNCFLGLHSTLKDNITIADQSLIGSSANVLKSIYCRGGVYIGNPARKIIGKSSILTL